MENNGWFRALIVLAVFSLALYLGSQLWEMARHFADIIIVFFLAWLVAFILSPIADFLERSYAMPRGLAASLVYLGLFVNVGVVFVLVVPLAVEQLVQLGQRLPIYVATIQEWGQGWAAFIQVELGNRGIALDLPSFYRSSDLAAQAGNLTSGLVANTIVLVSGVASTIASVTIVLVLSFYLVLDGARLSDGLLRLVPPTYQLECRYLQDSINRTFGGFLRGTLVIAFVYALGNALVMSVAGLGYVLLASLLAGVLMVVPLFGPVLAMVMPVLLAALQGDVTKAVLVLTGLLILQVLVFNVMSPKVMGQSVGMHPLLVFLALLVGIKQAGLIGAVFGVPVVGVAYAMVVYFIQKRDPAWMAALEAERSRQASRLVGQPSLHGLALRLRASAHVIAEKVAAALGRGQGDLGGTLRSGD